MKPSIAAPLNAVDHTQKPAVRSRTELFAPKGTQLERLPGELLAKIVGDHFETRAERADVLRNVLTALPSLSRTLTEHMWLHRAQCQVFKSVAHADASSLGEPDGEGQDRKDPNFAPVLSSLRDLDLSFLRPTGRVRLDIGTDHYGIGWRTAYWKNSLSLSRAQSCKLRDIVACTVSLVSLNLSHTPVADIFRVENPRFDCNSLIGDETETLKNSFSGEAVAAFFGKLQQLRTLSLRGPEISVHFVNALPLQAMGLVELDFSDKDHAHHWLRLAPSPSLQLLWADKICFRNIDAMDNAKRWPQLKIVSLKNSDLDGRSLEGCFSENVELRI